MLSPEIQEKVARLDAELKQIDAEIRQLQTQRDAVLRSDEQYADYLTAYESCYNDEPLTLREYYEHMAALDAINAEFNAIDAQTQSDAFDELWRKHEHELQYLERRLAA